MIRTIVFETCPLSIVGVLPDEFELDQPREDEQTTMSTQMSKASSLNLHTILSNQMTQVENIVNTHPSRAEAMQTAIESVKECVERLDKVLGSHSRKAGHGEDFQEPIRRGIGNRNGHVNDKRHLHRNESSSPGRKRLSKRKKLLNQYDKLQ